MGIRCNSLWIYCVGFIQKRGVKVSIVWMMCELVFGEFGSKVWIGYILVWLQCDLDVMWFGFSVDLLQVVE